MPKRSQELTRARREEIVEACAGLYEYMPFREITLGEIGKKTSFTRTSIYNYFHTKEEIFLALLEREYRAWTADLNALADAPVSSAFPARFSGLLEARGCMLRLLSMNLYDLETGSRIENLIAFKCAYNASIQAVEACLRAHYICTHEDEQQFIYAFFPFLFGVYPYTSHSEKQREAMERAGVSYRRYTAAALTGRLVEKLVAGWQQRV